MRHFIPILIAVVISGCSSERGKEAEEQPEKSPPAEVDPCAEAVAGLSAPDPFSAFEEIKNLQCQDALEHLREMMGPDNPRNTDVFRLTLALWSPATETHPEEAEKFPDKREIYQEIITRGLKDPRTAALAAATIGDWELSDLHPVLASVIDEDLR